MSNIKPYILLIQRKGPHYNVDDARRIIQAEHLPHLFKLRMDNTDLTAIAVYSLTDKNEVKKNNG